jgi:hypothetical protein
MEQNLKNSRQSYEHLKSRIGCWARIIGIMHGDSVNWSHGVPFTVFCCAAVGVLLYRDYSSLSASASWAGQSLSASRIFVAPAGDEYGRQNRR